MYVRVYAWMHVCMRVRVCLHAYTCSRMDGDTNSLVHELTHCLDAYMCGRMDGDTSLSLSKNKLHWHEGGVPKKQLLFGGWRRFLLSFCHIVDNLHLNVGWKKQMHDNTQPEKRQKILEMRAHVELWKHKDQKKRGKSEEKGNKFFEKKKPRDACGRR